MQFELRSPGRGSTGPWRRKNIQRLNDGAARATDRAALGARDELRAAMRAQRLGKLANVVGATSDLKKKRRGIRGGSKLDVAGFVTVRIRSPRTAGAFEAYISQDATEITPKHGRFLWIATNSIPRRAGRRRMTPKLYVETGQDKKIGPLQFIKGRTAGEAYLVVQSTTIRSIDGAKPRSLPKSGRVRAGRVEAGIVAFVGIRRTRRTRRVAPREVGKRWQGQLSDLLRGELKR